MFGRVPENGAGLPPGTMRPHPGTTSRAPLGEEAPADWVRIYDANYGGSVKTVQ